MWDAIEVSRGKRPQLPIISVQPRIAIILG